MTCACVEGCWQSLAEPCSDAGLPDAGGCRATGGPVSGACTTEGERRCISVPGCVCRSGCWSCSEDECWLPDTPMQDAGIDASLKPEDAPAMDAPPVVDAPLDAPLDAPRDAPLAPPDVPGDVPADAGVPETATYCVDIFVSNTCEMSVSPTEIDVPADQTAYFCWRNTSRDYPVDVWLSYGGGYTDLAPGATWNEPPGHCLGPLAHDEYADISTACSSHRFLIHCL